MKAIIIDDMRTRYEKNNDIDFSKDYLLGIDLLLGEVSAASKIIDDLKIELDNRNFIVAISEYLSNSSVAASIEFLFQFHLLDFVFDSH